MTTIIETRSVTISVKPHVGADFVDAAGERWISLQMIGSDRQAYATADYIGGRLDRFLCAERFADEGRRFLSACNAFVASSTSPALTS